MIWHKGIEAHKGKMKFFKSVYNHIQKTILLCIKKKWAFKKNTQEGKHIIRRKEKHVQPISDHWGTH